LDHPASNASLPRGFHLQTIDESAARDELLVLSWPIILLCIRRDHRCSRQPVHPGFPDPFGKMGTDQEEASKQRDERKPDKPPSTRASITEKESHKRAACLGA
jgi:hypothetical protein